MKNKKNIYFLLFVVLLIWGSVIYQFFSYSNDETVVEVSSGNFILKPLSIKEVDTFSIDVNYRDPFLGKIYTENSNNLNRKKTVKKQMSDSEPLIWPSIIYKGIVSDTKEKNKVFMLLIDGRTFLMKKGGIENEVLLKEGNRASITVIYKGSPLTILLNG